MTEVKGNSMDISQKKMVRIAQMQILFVMEVNHTWDLSIMEDYLSLPYVEDEMKTLKNEFTYKKRFRKNIHEESRLLDLEAEAVRSSIPEILKRLSTIDDYIRDHLHNWSIERLAKVDLSILRVAVYEFLFVEDLPMAVSINEAVEIAKIYSSLDSSKFINGILGSIYQTLEGQHEAIKDQ